MEGVELLHPSSITLELLLSLTYCWPRPVLLSVAGTCHPLPFSCEMNARLHLGRSDRRLMIFFKMYCTITSVPGWHAGNKLLFCLYR